MNNLKFHRLRAGETQAEAAARCGISIALLRELEAGRANPSERVATLLETAYGTRVDRLLRSVGIRR